MRAVLQDADGLAVNVIVVDDESDYEPPEDLVLVVIDDATPVGPGWQLAGDEWTPPDPQPETPPVTAEELQTRIAELQALLEQLLATNTDED